MKQQIDQFPKLVAVWKVIENRVVIAFIDLDVDLSVVSSWKGYFQRAKLIQNAAESPQVTPGVVRLTIPYFRSEIVGGSADVLGHDVLLGLEDL